MIRRTRQRSTVEAVFKRLGRPLTPSEVHAEARAHHSSIGLRTVYRQIQDMVDSGLLVGIDYPGQPLRYEWVDLDHKSHFICHGCKRLFELGLATPEIPVGDVGRFRITGQETIFYGYCPDCEDPEPVKTM